MNRINAIVTNNNVFVIESIIIILVLRITKGDKAARKMNLFSRLVPKLTSSLLTNIIGNIAELTISDTNIPIPIPDKPKIS